MTDRGVCVCVCVSLCVCVCVSLSLSVCVCVCQPLSPSASSDVHSAQLNQTCRFISNFLAISLSLWKYFTLSLPLSLYPLLSLSLSLSPSLPLSLSIAPGFDSYEIIMKQQSARVRLGAKLSVSLCAVCYLWLPVPPLTITVFSLLYSPRLWMVGWMDECILLFYSLHFSFVFFIILLSIYFHSPPSFLHLFLPLSSPYALVYYLSPAMPLLSPSFLSLFPSSTLSNPSFPPSTFPFPSMLPCNPP